MRKRYYARAALGKEMTCHICLQPVSFCLWYIEGMTIYKRESRMCQICALDYWEGPGKKYDSETHKLLEVIDE